MEQVELVLGMFAVMAALAVAAPRLRVPYPVLLVVGGAAAALIPGLPELRIDPAVVLFVFLPPLLYAAAIRMDVGDLKENAGDITLLAVGLVVVTTVCVAAVAKSLVSTLSWPAAFVLGAVVSPPDPVAATAVAERLGLSRRVRLLLEAEGVFNDATALVLYRVTVAAVVGTLSVGGAAVEFVVAGVVAVIIGLLVGWVGARILGKIAEAPVENTVTVLIPYVSYLLAERAHASGVLAVLVTGLYLGRRARHVITSRARLQGQGLWDMIVFVLEGLAFLLIGLQLRQVMTAGHGHATRTLVTVSAAVIVTAVVVRFIWVAGAARLARTRGPERHALSQREARFLGWAGMRGLVTMAAVLGLPLATSDGRPFPERQVMVFVAFAVIGATLVVQGCTVGVVAARLGLVEPVEERAEELRGRASTAAAALAWLEDSPMASELSEQQIAYLRNRYVTRLDDVERFSALHRDVVARASTLQARRELIEAERRELERLRSEEDLSYRVYTTMRRALDEEEARLDRVS